MKKGIYRIEITIKTPRLDITEWFDLANYDTPKEWVKAAKDWIKKEK